MSLNKQTNKEETQNTTQQPVAKNKGGRPRKWKHPKELEEQIQSYFELVKEKEEMPTKAGLAIHLNTNRETLGDYVKNNKGIEHGEKYSDIIKYAYSVIENAWTQRLAGTTPTGAIFYLKSAFKYKDRFDVTSDEKAIEGNKIMFVDFSNEAESQ